MENSLTLTKFLEVCDLTHRGETYDGPIIIFVQGLRVGRTQIMS